MATEQKHILYVEDAEDAREAFGHFFSHKGFRVTTAENGREGLEKAFQLKPDLILMDLWLPEVGGWQAVQCLKTDQRTRHIPVVVITGHSPLRPEVLGCEGMLTKPMPPEVLLEEIRRVLDNAQFKTSSAN